MECIHLKECVLLNANNDLITSKALGSLGKSGKPPSEWSCKDCGTVQSPWICLSCGEIHCGRYVNAHALDHHRRSVDHCVCMDCVSYAVYCYKCDEFVINDTERFHVDAVRHCLQKLESLSMATGSQLASESGDKATDGEENVNDKRDLKRRSSADSCDQKKKKVKTDENDKMKKTRKAGLRNLGNTCFMNAVLQSLSNIQHFCRYIKQLPSLEDRIPTTSVKKKIVTRRTKEPEEDILLVEELRKTLIALWQGSKTAISPESLFSVIWKVVPRFRGYQQQDAHEFMRYLLDRLHSELLSLLPYPNNNSPYIGPKSKQTIVTAIFGGILQSEVKCLVCGMESKKHDPFLDLSLDIPQHFTAKSHKPKENETVAKLSDCLASFTDVEELEDSELYMCTYCKCRQRSTKKFWLRRLPNVLCLHLKRFRWNVYYRMKVETYVDFPIRGLEMSGFTLDSQHETRGSGGGPGNDVYDLAAVIVHHGSGAGSGHYTAYAVHDKVWYHFNDSSVTVCDEATVKKCKAYILFYIRRQLTLPEHLRL